MRAAGARAGVRVVPPPGAALRRLRTRRARPRVRVRLLRTRGPRTPLAEVVSIIIIPSDETKKSCARLDATRLSRTVTLPLSVIVLFFYHEMITRKYRS